MRNPSYARYLLRIGLSTMMIVLLESCGLARIEQAQPLNTPVPGPATESTPVLALAQTLVANPSYLDECKDINASRMTGQIPFKGVWPGRTKESELEYLLGVPDSRDTIKGVTNWGYSNMGVFAEEGVVTDLLVDVDKKSALSLEQLVLKYGCPDLILAVNTTQDQFGYTATSLIYLNLGVDFRFMGNPFSLADVPQSIEYFEPTNLQEHLERNGWNIMGIYSGKPVDWEEAVR